MTLEQRAPWARLIGYGVVVLASVVGTFAGLAVLEFALSHSKPRRHKDAP
jgi:hypothetical protein